MLIQLPNVNIMKLELYCIIRFKGNNQTFKLSMPVHLKAHFTKHIHESVNSLTDFLYILIGYCKSTFNSQFLLLIY